MFRTLLTLLLLLGIASPAAGQSGSLFVRPVPLNPEAPDQTRVGRLAFRGGMQIGANDPRFGGVSALHVDADGRRVLAVSDSGLWFRMRLVRDETDRLAGIRTPELGPLADSGGYALSGKRKADAESLAVLPGGDIVVAFERDHRLWRYPAVDPPFSQAPTPLRAPPGLSRAPGNGGIEALTALPDGRLLAITEDMAEPENRVAAWVGGDGGWRRLSYARVGDFKPTGAATLANGDVVVLERRYSPTTGPGARLVLLRQAAMSGETVLRGEEIAVIAPPLTVDNFEGIAARTGAAGETLIYLVSDDNFNRTQRTLLLLFALGDTD